MDEQPAPPSVTTTPQASASPATPGERRAQERRAEERRAEERHLETLAELAGTPTPAAAAARAAPTTKKPTPQALIGQANAQLDAIRQNAVNAETIKQLQKQVTLLEGQSKDAGIVLLATMTSLATAAFGLVAALAWNDAIQALFKAIFPSSLDAGGLVISAFVYALFVTIIAVVVIYQLGRLNSRFGKKSLIGGNGKEG